MKTEKGKDFIFVSRLDSRYGSKTEKIARWEIRRHDLFMVCCSREVNGSPFSGILLCENELEINKNLYLGMFRQVKILKQQ